MDKLPNQVSALVEFIWYAPVFNLILAGVLLWVALTLALKPVIESFVLGKLSVQGNKLVAISAALLLILLYVFAIWQKCSTVSDTRVGIANYMVRAGLRDISFDQIRQTINSEYSNSLLLAVGDSSTEKPVFRLSILKSLSLKLLDSTRLKRIQKAEQVLADTLNADARHLALHYPQAISVKNGKRRIGLLFREIDEVIFPKYSQLLIVATLRDYPERFTIRPNQTQLPPDSVYVALEQSEEISKPLWSRAKRLIR